MLKNELLGFIETLEKQDFSDAGEFYEAGYLNALKAVRKWANKPSPPKLRSAQEQAEETVKGFLKPFFLAYPEVKQIPLFAWGRYYKYESAGRPFESDVMTFEDFDSYSIKGVKRKELQLLDKAVEEYVGLDEEPFEMFYEKVFPFRRSWYSPIFDERFGRAIVATFNHSKQKVELNIVECDSPE